MQRQIMKINLDITLKEDGHDLKYKCTKPYGIRVNGFDPKKSLGCLVIAFEYFAELTGFCADNPNEEQVKMFKKWIDAEKAKCGVK